MAIGVLALYGCGMHCEFPRRGASAVVQLRNIHKEITNGRHRRQVLQSVNFQVFSRELTTIVGASGSGKTTLLRVIGCISPPDSGTLGMFSHPDVYAQGDSELSRYRNRTVGFVFQDYRLLNHYNVLQNVMLPMKVAGLNGRQQGLLARRALDVVGLTSFRSRRVDRLSGGQAQRVSIARALAMRPKLLIADEPTGNLDSVRTGEIMELFERLRARQGVSIVMVTHDRDLASQADHLITLVDGRVQRDSYAPA